MEQQDRQYTEDDAMKVILTPQAYEKYLQDKYGNQKELTPEEKSEIDKQMSDPFRTSDSPIVHWAQDLWEHPEKVKWYRDHVLFPTIEQKYYPERVDENPNEWKVEIPVFSMDF